MTAQQSQGSPDEAAETVLDDFATEVVGARTETTATFTTNEAGVYRTEVYAEPVHFEQQGEWTRIDPTLTRVGSEIRTAATPVKVDIATTSTDPELVALDFTDGTRATFGITAAKPANAQVDGPTATFEEVAPSADVTLEADAFGVKETLILHGPSAPTTWRFPLTLDGLTASLDPESGSVLLHKIGAQAGSAPTAVIPHGWMADASYETGERSPELSYSEGVTYGLHEELDGLVLEVTLDEKWLMDPDRRWPVVVDPTLTQVTAASDDTWVTPYVSTDRSHLSYLYAGSLGWFANRAFVHLDTSAVTNKVVHHAEFKMYQSNGSTCTETPTELHAVSEAWTSSAQDPLTWVEQPDVEDEPATLANSAMGATGCTAGRWVVWGATDLVRRWANGSLTNHGLGLRAPAGEEVDPDYWKSLQSSSSVYTPAHLQVIWSETGATGVPAAPSDISPTGIINDNLPELSATYTDPQSDNGYVIFVVYDDATNEQVAVLTGSTVASGQRSTVTPPTGSEALYDRPYRIEAHAVDTGWRWSLTSGTSTFTVSSVTLSPIDGLTAFHDQTIEATSVGGYTIDEVVFRVDEENIATDSNGLDGWSTTWDTTEITDGEHTLQAVVHVDSESYLSPPVQVTVANALLEEDRIEVDYAQGTLDLDAYVLTRLRSLAGSPLLPDRYGDAASSSDHGSTGAQMVLLGEHWGDMTNAGRQAVREATYLRGDGVEAGDPPSGHGYPHPDPDGSGLASCSGGSRVHGNFTGDRDGWWCMAEYSYTTDFGGTEAHVPDLRFFFTVGSRPDDVPPADSSGIGGGSANDVPDDIDQHAHQIFVAFEEYGRMGFHWDDWYDSHALAVGVWDVDRSSVSFFDDDTGDLAGLHPITLDQDESSSTARHEAFHVVEYDYVSKPDLASDEPIGGFHYGRTSTAWFVEASAEWAASEVAKRRGLTDADDPPSSKIAHFLSNPSVLLTHIDGDAREYGAVAFLEYLEERLGPTIVRQVWEDIDGEETAEQPDEAIDFIEARAAAADEPLDELVPDFWAAVYLLTNSNIDTPVAQIPEEQLELWRDQLDAHGPTVGDTTIPSARAARHDVSDSSPEASLDESVTVQAGGATFVDIVPDGVVGDVDVHIDGQSGGDTSVVVLPYGPLGFPYLCTTELDSSSGGYQVHPTDSGGGWEGTVSVTPTCPSFSIALVHNAPQLYDSTILGDPDEVFTHVAVEILDPQPVDPIDWDLDTSFAGDGKVELPDGFIPKLVFTDPEGRLVLARNDEAALDVLRYLPDGRVDTGFGTSGRATYELPETAWRLTAMESHEDGYAFLSTNESEGQIHIAVGRVRDDGSLDPTIGVDGIATHSSPGRDQGTDGDIGAGAMFISATALVGGVSGDNAGPLIGKVHLTGPDAGEMDTNFSGDGWTHVIQNPDGTSNAFGGIEVVGSRALVATYDYDTYEVITTAFNTTSGAVDTSYGTSGSMSISDFDASAAHTQRLHAHISHTLFSDRQRSTRMTSTGNVDTAWGSSGVLGWPATNPVVDTFLDHTYAGFDDVDDIIVHAYTDAGSLDTDYWGDGIAVIDPHQGVYGITEGPSQLGGYGVVVATGAHIYRLLPSTP